jgi:hypothetical protein
VGQRPPPCVHLPPFIYKNENGTVNRTQRVKKHSRETSYVSELSRAVEGRLTHQPDDGVQPFFNSRRDGRRDYPNCHSTVQPRPRAAPATIRRWAVYDSRRERSELNCWSSYVPSLSMVSFLTSLHRPSYAAACRAVSRSSPRCVIIRVPQCRFPGRSGLPVRGVAAPTAGLCGTFMRARTGTSG